MMKGEYRAAGVTVSPGEIGRTFKSWATADTGATVIGVAGGIALGEYLGSWLVTQFNIEDGWTKLIAKAIAKAGLSFVFFFIARRITPGLGRVLCHGIAAGPLVSIIGDVVGEVVAPGLGLIPGSSSSSITIKPTNSKNIPANVGNRSSVITTV